MSLCHLFSTREEGSALTLLSSFDKIRSLSLCHYVIMSFVFHKGGRKCLNIIIIFCQNKEFVIMSLCHLFSIREEGSALTLL